MPAFKFLKIQIQVQIVKEENWKSNKQGGCASLSGITYIHDAVTSVASILSRVSGNIVYLSLMNPSKPDCCTNNLLRIKNIKTNCMTGMHYLCCFHGFTLYMKQMPRIPTKLSNPNAEFSPLDFYSVQFRFFPTWSQIAKLRSTQTTCLPKLTCVNVQVHTTEAPRRHNYCLVAMQFANAQ